MGSSWIVGSRRSVRRSRRTTRSASRVWTVRSQARMARESRIVGAARSARSKVVWTRSSASASSRAIARAAASSIGPWSCNVATQPAADTGVGTSCPNPTPEARSCSFLSSVAVMTLTSHKRRDLVQTGIASQKRLRPAWRRARSGVAVSLLFQPRWRRIGSWLSGGPPQRADMPEAVALALAWGAAFLHRHPFCRFRGRRFRRDATSTGI